MIKLTKSFRTLGTLAITLGALAVSRASAQESGLFSYQVVDGEVEITDYPESATGPVVVPGEIEGLPVTAIGAGAFENCGGIEGVTIPEGVVRIGVRSFADCAGLLGVALPTTLTNLGSGAFTGCVQLATVEIPVLVTEIASFCFFGCTALTSVALPDGLVRFGSNAFAGCVNLQDLDLPAGLSEIGGAAFSGCAQLTELVIPNGVVTIGNLAFNGCGGLEEVTIPASVATIGVSAFGQCGQLQSISVASGNSDFTSAGGVLFDASGGRLLQYPGGRSGAYVVPVGVWSIEYGAFSGAAAMSQVQLPAALERIGISAFLGCSGLTSLSIPAGVSIIGSYAFSECLGLASIVVPDGVSFIGDAPFWGCENLESIEVGAANTHYTAVDSVLFDAAMATLIQFPGGRSGHYDVPDGVVRIGVGAFAGSAGLTSIDLPEGVSQIASSAFRECGALGFVALPASLASVGSFAFADSGNLSSALFRGDAPASFAISVFAGTSPDFSVYYYADRSGFSSPIWQGYPAEAIDASAYPAAAWLLGYGLPYDSDLAEDPNGDGVSLLTAYGLNLDPTMNLAGSLPEVVIGSETMTLTYYAATPGVVYLVEVSADFIEWETDGVMLSELDAENQQTASVDLAESPRRFLRLSVLEGAPAP